MPRRTVVRMSEVFAIGFDGPTDGSVVLRVAGEVDMATAPELEAHVRKALDRDEPTVLVDLTEVTFIDSSGIAALTGLHRQLEERRRRLTILGLNDVTRRPFEVLKLDEVLDLA